MSVRRGGDGGYPPPRAEIRTNLGKESSTLALSRHRRDAQSRANLVSLALRSLAATLGTGKALQRGAANPSRLAIAHRALLTI